MNEFKSKRIIPDDIIRMKLYQGAVFSESESLECLLLNE